MVAKETKAISGIAWNCSSQPFLPICQTRSNSHDNLKIGISESEHVSLLNRAVVESEGERKSLLIKQRPGPTAAENENPVIAISVVRQGGSVDLVELFLPHGLDEDEYEKSAKSLDQYCNAATECTLPPANNQANASKDANSSARQISPNELDTYVHQIHRSLDLKHTAIQIANEARRVLDCDRVSVIQAKGKRCKVTAVSGQASVNSRSNTIYLLRKLTRNVLATKKTFWYPTDDELPKEIEEPLHAYLAIAATRFLVVVPIMDQAPQDLDAPNSEYKEERVIGGLVIEHCSEHWERIHVSDAVEVVARHASDAFRNSYHHRQLLFFPVWNSLGKSKTVLAARNLPKTVVAILGVILLGMILAFYPANLKIACDGVLVPQQRSKIFVPIDGVVSKTSVRHGSIVEKDAPLVTLVNNDLENEAIELDGRIREAKLTIENTETLLLSPNPNDQELGQQDLNAQKAQLISLQRQRDLVERKLIQLQIKSPHAGQVITWNVEDRLKNRPVSRGEELMEVVNVDGDWQLELLAPDRGIGHIQAALAAKKEPLDVKFILAATPEKQFTGKLIEIGKATQLSPDSGPVVSLIIEVDLQDELDIRQIKSSVSANVICEEVSLGYAWFHGVSEFVQKQWFRLF